MSENVFIVPPFEPHRWKNDLRTCFPGMTVRVDEFVTRYAVLGAGRRVALPRLVCTIVTPKYPKGADAAFRSIMRRLPNGEFIGSKTLVSMIEYLGTERGMAHLAIPEGEDEVNLILGYAHDGDDVVVIYVEHEFEDGVREIHIHARPVETWGNDVPHALLVLNEEPWPNQ